MAPLKLGGLSIGPPLILAPMAGLTDTHFRGIVKRCGGVGMVVGEIASSEAVSRRIKRSLDLLEIGDGEHPVALQISGGNASRMAEAAKICQDAGADVVDINMGCPAPKVTKSVCGAALMREPSRAAEILRAVVAAVSVPVTVKMRLGWSPAQINFLELAAAMADSGATAVTLHARTRDQGYSGRADWEQIKALKEISPVPIVGNGDATTPEQVIELFRQTGCDAVMVGRAALSNPWIFRQAEQLASRGCYGKVSTPERFELIAEHFRLLLGEENRGLALHRMKSFLGRYTKGLVGAAPFRAELSRFRTPEEIYTGFSRWANDFMAPEAAPPPDPFQG